MGRKIRYSGSAKKENGLHIFSRLLVAVRKFTEVPKVDFRRSNKCSMGRGIDEIRTLEFAAHYMKYIIAIDLILFRA